MEFKIIGQKSPEAVQKIEKNKEKLIAKVKEIDPHSIACVVKIGNLIRGKQGAFYNSRLCSESEDGKLKVIKQLQIRASSDPGFNTSLSSYTPKPAKSAENTKVEPPKIDKNKITKELAEELAQLIKQNEKVFLGSFYVRDAEIEGVKVTNKAVVIGCNFHYSVSESDVYGVTETSIRTSRNYRSSVFFGSQIKKTIEELQSRGKEWFERMLDKAKIQTYEAEIEENRASKNPYWQRKSVEQNQTLIFYKTLFNKIHITNITIDSKKPSNPGRDDIGKIKKIRSRITIHLS